MKRHQLYIILVSILAALTLFCCSVDKGHNYPANDDLEHLKDSPDDQGDDPTRPTNDPMTLDSLRSKIKTLRIHDNLLPHEQPRIQVGKDQVIK